MNKKTKHTIATILAALVCITLFAVKLTGELVHVILAFAVTIAIIVHICKKKKRLNYIPKSWRTTDLMIGCSTVVIFITGMMLHSMQGVIMITILHKLAAVIMVIGCIVHCWQHKKKGNV